MRSCPNKYLCKPKREIERKMTTFNIHLVLFVLFAALPVLLPGYRGMVTLAGPIAQPLFAVNETDITPTCKAKYTCGSGTQDAIECSCHRYCNLFDSCCDNYRTASTTYLNLLGVASPLPSDTFSCVSIFDLTAKLARTFSSLQTSSAQQGFNSINVITKCPTSYQRTSTRRLCEHPLSQTENGTLSTPVTDDFTGFTYRNAYCALCHNMLPGKVWRAYNVCSTAAQNSGASACRTGYLPPVAYPESWLHYCVAGTIQGCPETAKVQRRLNCINGPTQFVYDNFNQAVYRNWNCAICYTPASPLWECSRGWVSNSAASVTTSTLLGESRDYICPRQLSASMQSNERVFWQAQCPKLCKINPAALGKK